MCNIPQVYSLHSVDQRMIQMQMIHLHTLGTLWQYFQIMQVYKKSQIIGKYTQCQKTIVHMFY